MHTLHLGCTWDKQTSHHKSVMLHRPSLNFMWIVVDKMRLTMSMKTIEVPSSSYITACYPILTRAKARSCAHEMSADLTSSASPYPTHYTTPPSICRTSTHSFLLALLLRGCSWRLWIFDLRLDKMLRHNGGSVARCFACSSQCGCNTLTTWTNFNTRPSCSAIT